MRKLNIIKILEYYDVPQLFVAEDEIGTRYLCLLYDISENGDLKCIGVPISIKKLNDFIKRHIDLRMLYLSPELENSICLVVVGENSIIANPYYDPIDESMLPDEGYFYDDRLEEDAEMIEHAVRSNKQVIQIAFQTPDNSHVIDTRCLSAALLHFQSFVSNSYKKLYKDDSSCSNLKVTTFSAASFDVEFEAEESLDLFGQSLLGNTMNIINKSFSESEDDVVETLRAIQGYAVNSYKKFINVLIENDLSIDLKWVSSTLNREVHHNSISKQHLQLLYNIVNRNSNLGKEIKIYEGCFYAASAVSGTWRFKPNEDNEIKGKCIDLTLLSGVTLKNCMYRIVCETEQTQNDTTLKEKVDYTLISLEIIKL